MHHLRSGAGRGLHVLSQAPPHVLPRGPEESAVSTWQFRGACHDADPEAFFPAKVRATREDCAEALAYRDECLDFALDNRERSGVWGGTTEFERDVMVRQGRRAEREDAEVA